MSIKKIIVIILNKNSNSHASSFILSEKFVKKNIIYIKTQNGYQQLEDIEIHTE